MKKIGILTYFTDIPYFNDINPGMNLQAYGVFMVLRDQYPDAQIEFIRYHSWCAIWRVYLSGITVESLIKDFKQFYKYYKFTHRFNLSTKALVTSNYDKANRFIDSLKYDAVYVGSDTLLELFRAPLDEITAYWLSSEIKVKKYMIAASARDTSYVRLTDIQKRKLQASINDFQALGVRDKATYSLINNFIKEGDARLELVPDPTFYFNIDYKDADHYARKSGIANCNKPIVCFHLLKTDLFSSDLAELYHKQGYLIASLRPAKYADFLLKDLSPMEYAGIFKYFEITITHRFHDTVFSIKNLSPVLVYLPSDIYKNENGDSKQSSLVASFDIKEFNYVEEIQKLSVEEIKRKADVAMLAFNDRKGYIKKQLIQYKEQIKDYINKTSLL